MAQEVTRRRRQVVRAEARLVPTADERCRSSGSSASSLHAKTFTADRSRVFIGSFNFDPRSARLNTENGFIIESPAMAQTISDAFSSKIPERSYEVKLSATGGLEWIERRDGGQLVHT